MYKTFAGCSRFIAKSAVPALLACSLAILSFLAEGVKPPTAAWRRWLKLLLTDDHHHAQSSSLTIMKSVMAGSVDISSNLFHVQNSGKILKFDFER
ncbi:hypothetical protein R1flu_018790 [Riccia fluitans]|uniref:Uncharacterized protein n=1 Tax=Riccia fluitans TaxID=41844 RepID=A0ABD1ZHW3_9MARC